MQRHRVLREASLFLAALLFTLGFASSRAHAERIHSSAFIALGGAVTPGGTIELVPVGGNQNQPFIVPSGKDLVLTDIIISPKSFPPTGQYLWGVNAPPPFSTTALSVTSTATDASSFQVHLKTGMLFQSGSKVRVGLVFGSNDVDVSAFGYLVKQDGED
jgi:hypothetical protein